MLPNGMSVYKMGFNGGISLIIFDTLRFDNCKTFSVTSVGTISTRLWDKVFSTE